MAAIYQTAYPRIKSDITPNELGDVYTPTSEDLEFALRHCKRTSAAFLGLLIQLKTTQQLGRFVPLGEIPKVIIAHIKNQCRSRVTLWTSPIFVDVWQGNKLVLLGYTNKTVMGMLKWNTNEQQLRIVFSLKGF